MAPHSSTLAGKSHGRRSLVSCSNGVAKSRMQLSNFPFTFHLHALEKEMAPHSSVLAWRIPGTGEPGGLPSMGSHRVGPDWSDLAAAAAAVRDIIGHLVNGWREEDSKMKLCFLICPAQFLMSHKLTSPNLCSSPSSSISVNITAVTPLWELDWGS